MKVISTNISEPKTIIWKGKDEQTGIYKKSVTEIFLDSTDVENDAVIDRKYHGGEHKACYLYSTDHYDFWKSKYPDLDWHFGMFGENLSIEELDETQLFIGDTFKIGEAIIQISEPRLPCYKLGIKFDNPKVIKEFANSTFCGAYVRVLQNGKVQQEDTLKIIKKQNGIKLSEVYSIFFSEKGNQNLIQKAIQEPFLSEKFKSDIRRKLL